MRRRLTSTLAAVGGVTLVAAVTIIAAVTATASAGTAGAHAARPAAPGGTWSAAIPLTGLSTITGLTCTSPGNCVVVGQGTADGASVATERNGVWHAARRFTADGKTAVTIGAVTAVACSSQGNCVAGGYGYFPSGGDPTAWVAVEKNGTWGSAQLISASTIQAISCVPNGGCTTVGSRYPVPNETVTTGMVVAESDGTWGKPEVIPEPTATSWPYFSLDWISCAAGGDCSAGGYVYNGGSGGYQEDMSVLVTETNGVWGAATLVPGLPSAGSNQVANNGIAGLSCRAPGDCTAAGTYHVTTFRPGNTVASGSFLITETGGTWQPTVLIPAAGSGYYVSSLSCLSVGHCVITGHDASNGDPVAADVVNGSVSGKPAILPGSAGLNIDTSSSLVSCVPTGYCAVLGSYTVSGPPGSSYKAFVAVKTAAGWHPIQAVRGIPQPPGVGNGPTISGISCTATGSCTAAGSYIAEGGASQAFAVDEATTSATRLKTSTPKITYGHEQTEHLTVDVTSRYANALTGTVTIKKGSTTLAVLTLKSGRASWTLTAKRLKGGSYALTATYSGNAAYLASTSAAVKVKVVKIMG